MVLPMNEIDPHTLRVAASLVRSRIARLKLDPRMDGLQRLGAHRTLTQLAVDLKVSANYAGPPRRRKRTTSTRSPPARGDPHPLHEPLIGGRAFGARLTAAALRARQGGREGGVGPGVSPRPGTRAVPTPPSSRSQHGQSFCQDRKSVG